MIRSEIKNFTMSFPKCEAELCSAPATLFSVLRARGIFTYPSCEEDARYWREYFDSPCEFSATFDLTDADVKRKYIFLRFYALEGVADISLNGQRLAVANNSHKAWTLDIKGICRVGKNSLKLVFSPEASYGSVSHKFESEYGIPLADAGITGKVELLKFNNAIIDSIGVTPVINGDSAAIHISLQTLGSSDSVKAVATLISGAGQVYYGGLSGGQGSIHVRDPLYWWPRGLGVQNLYRLTVNLYGEYDIEDAKEYQIGICSLGLNDGASGALAMANGVSFMPMGAYFTLPDDVISSETNEKIDALVMAAANANCNTLVVSGSAGFASDRLLSACDTYGITVWQELPYSISGAKVDEEGYKSALTSALKRISYHTCLLAVVDAEGRPEGLDVELLCKNAAPRLSFMSREAYGQIALMSCPAIVCDRTLKKLAPDEDNLLSNRMEWHCGDNVDRMLIEASREYLYAANLSDFAYLTRLVQANKITDYARGARVNRSFGGAAIISRLTDSRPTVSDSLVDYFCCPKAASAYATSFFSPLLLIPKVDGGRVSFAVSNERRQAFEGLIYYRILDAQNNPIYHGSEDIKVSEMSIAISEGRDFSEVIKGHENEYYLEYGLREGAVSITKSTLLFVKPKRFLFRDPAIEAHINGAGRSYSITIRAESFAKDVEICFDGMDVAVSENYFDITSSAPLKISISVPKNVETTAFELENALRIRCVNTIGKVNKSLKKDRFDIKKQEILKSLDYDLW